MKRQRLDLSEERKLLIYMITSTRFLEEIRRALKLDLLESAYARIVGSWVLEYHEQFGEAPGRAIQDIYLRKRTTLREEDEVGTIAEFLSSLAKEHEASAPNTAYAVESAVQYLKLRSLTVLKQQLDGVLESKDVLAGEQLVATYERIEKHQGGGTDLMWDGAALRRAFMDEEEVLFRLPGDLGEMAGDFVRGDLVTVLGVSNRGKSWWLWYLGQRAIQMGLKVIHFNLEMTENQVTRRAWQGMTGRPRKTQMIRLPQFVEAPNAGEDKWVVKMREEEREGVDLAGIEDRQAMYRRYFRGGNARLNTFPAFTASVEDLEACVDNYEYYDRFFADVVIVDHGDLVAPVRQNEERRHEIDEVIKNIRALAQKRNQLWITASQLNRAGFSKDASLDIIAEDIRKVFHSSKILGLSQNAEDEEMGLMRLRLLKERDGRRSMKEVAVLMSLDIARPYLDSRWVSRLDR